MSIEKFKMTKPENPMRLSEVRDWEAMPNTQERAFTNPYEAIRAKCLDCTGYSPQSIAECHITKCTLWPFRFGHSPFASRKMTDEQREAASARLARFRPGSELGSDPDEADQADATNPT